MLMHRLALLSSPLMLLAGCLGFNIKTLQFQPRHFGVINPAQIKVQPQVDDCGGAIRDYDISAGWHTCQAEKMGVNATRLKEAIKKAAGVENRTSSVLVIRRGYIVGEGYFGCDDRDGAGGCTDQHTLHHSWSVAKGVTATLVGLAIADGKISSVDDKAGQWVAQWRYPGCLPFCDGRQNITVRHLMTLTTGLNWHEDWNSDVGVWNFPGNLDVAFLDGRDNSRDPVDFVSRHRLRTNDSGLDYQPGEYPFYSTGDPAVLSQVLQGAVEMKAADYADARLFGPLGMKVDWSSDKSGRTRTYAKIHTTARDFAKFGQLYLNRGRWNQTQLVPYQWIDEELTPCGGLWNKSLNYEQQHCYPFYGYLWHLELPMRFAVAAPPSLKKAAFIPEDIKNLPHDAFMAEGIFGQMITVIPSLDLVIVRTADDTRLLEVQDRVNIQLVQGIIDALEHRQELIGGPHQIKSDTGSLCLSSSTNRSTMETPLTVAPCTTRDSGQNWYIKTTSGRGYVRLLHIGSGLCAAGAASSSSRGRFVMRECKGNDADQDWMIVDLGHGQKKIVGRNPAVSLDWTQLMSTNGSKPQTPNLSDATKFQFIPSGRVYTDTAISQRDFKQLTSVNQRFTVKLQSDGNLVVLDRGRQVWSTNTGGRQAVIARVQNDGNIVLMRGDQSVVWQTHTTGKGLLPFRFTITDTGELLLRDSLDQITWRN